MQEFEIIKKFFRPLSFANSDTKFLSTKKSTSKIPQLPTFSSLNLEDDIAILNNKKNSNFVVSKDIFIEDIHFLKQDGAEKIASKLLLTNISDIASSGARPLCYLLGFTKHSSNDKKFFDEFARGLRNIQEKYNLNLIGGDTSRSKKLFYSVTIFGATNGNNILLRKNAESGDLIFVSNYIGEAFLGLNIKLQKSKQLKNFEKKLLDKHFYPQPRIDLGEKLLKYNLSKCATDISDGLIADLTNICNASRLNAKIFLNKIPFSSASKSYLKQHPKINKIDLITGGDDYELIFTINPRNLKKILKLEKELNLKLTCIGEFFNNHNQKLKSPKFEVSVFENESPQQKPLIILKKGYEH